MTFGEKLKAAREQAGLSQRELGEKAGVTRDAVSSLEQGRRSPNWDTVQALALALSISCEALRDDEKDAAHPVRAATPTIGQEGQRETPKTPAMKKGGGK